MNNTLFLTAAYMIIWGVLFGYLFYANRQQHKLLGKVRMLEERLSVIRSQKR